MVDWFEVIARSPEPEHQERFDGQTDKSCLNKKPCARMKRNDLFSQSILAIFSYLSRAKLKSRLETSRMKKLQVVSIVDSMQDSRLEVVPLAETMQNRKMLLILQGPALIACVAVRKGRSHLGRGWVSVQHPGTSLASQLFSSVLLYPD